MVITTVKVYMGGLIHIAELCARRDKVITIIGTPSFPNDHVANHILIIIDIIAILYGLVYQCAGTT